LSKTGTSIIKNFSLTERQKIRFSADLFDVWNHPGFSSPAFTGVRNRLRLGNLARRKIIGESFSFRLNGYFDKHAKAVKFQRE
jgi:hypothetical protein